MPLRKENRFQTRVHPFIATTVLSMLAIAFLVLLLGCSKSGGNDMHVKSPATGEKNLSVKSSYAFAVTKSFTDISGKISTAVSYRVYAANYDLDSSFFAQTLDKPFKSDDDMRVVFNLVGEQGGTEKSAVKIGTYSAKADKFMKVEDVAIVSRKGGADNRFFLDRSTLNGQVKVTTATADEIAGDIDITGGDNIIKGSFTAKVLKRK